MLTKQAIAKINQHIADGLKNSPGTTQSGHIPIHNDTRKCDKCKNGTVYTIDVVIDGEMVTVDWCNICDSQF